MTRTFDDLKDLDFTQLVRVGVIFQSNRFRVILYFKDEYEYNKTSIYIGDGTDKNGLNILIISLLNAILQPMGKYLELSSPEHCFDVTPLPTSQTYTYEELTTEAIDYGIYKGTPNNSNFEDWAHEIASRFGGNAEELEQTLNAMFFENTKPPAEFWEQITQLYPSIQQYADEYMNAPDDNKPQKEQVISSKSS